MPHFRCYFFDQDHRIVGRAELQVDRLRAAIERAIELKTGRPQCHSIEIWQGDQRLYPDVTEKGIIEEPDPPDGRSEFKLNPSTVHDQQSGFLLTSIARALTWRQSGLPCL